MTPRVEQREALAHRVGLRLRAGLRRDDGQVAAGLPGLGQAQSKKRCLDASAPECGSVAAPHNCASPSSIRRLAAPAGLVVHAEQVALKSGRRREVDEEGLEQLARVRSLRPGALPSGVPNPSSATSSHVRQSSCGNRGDGHAVQVRRAVVVGDRSAEDVFKAGHPIAARGQHRRHRGIGQRRQLEAHRLAAIGPGLLDRIKRGLVDRRAEPDADGLVGRRAGTGKHRLTAGDGRDQRARGRRAGRDRFGNRHRQAHLGADRCARRGSGTEHEGRWDADADRGRPIRPTCGPTPLPSQSRKDRPQPLDAGGHFLRQHADVADDRHEVGVAGPARHDVHVQVVGDAGAGGLAEIDADVQALRAVHLGHGDFGARGERPSLRRSSSASAPPAWRRAGWARPSGGRCCTG